MAIGTVADYKTTRAISGSGYDTILASMLSCAEAELRRACGRDLSNGFESASRTEYYDGTDAETIQLREWPITSITSVYFVEGDASLTSVASTEYRVNALTGILYMLGATRGRFVRDTTGVLIRAGGDFGVSPSWDVGFQNVKVTYVGGYSSIPGDLKEAMYSLIDAAFAARGKDPSIQSESIGAYSRTMRNATDTNDSITRIISVYKTGSL